MRITTIITLLLLSAPLRAQGDDSAQTLRDAARSADAVAVEASLDAGADVNAQSAVGMNALGYAIIGCARYDAPDSRGDLAARLRTIEVLVRRGADVDLADEHGNVALMSAAQLCPIEVTEKLIASGARLDVANMQDFTPLQMAFVMGRWDVAERLVGHGARLDRAAVDSLFIEKPKDPRQRALLERAIRR